MSIKVLGSLRSFKYSKFVRQERGIASSVVKAMSVKVYVCKCKGKQKFA